MNVKTCGSPLLSLADQTLPTESDCGYDKDWILLGQERPIECHVYLLEEEDGGFSVWASRLPGVASQGRTEEEALANFSEAFRGACEAYASRGDSIPWLDQPQDRPTEAKELWIVVDA